MKTILQALLLCGIVISVLAGCGRKTVVMQDGEEPAYFDGWITLSDTGSHLFIDRANFVRLLVTDESLDKLAPVLESVVPGDTSTTTRWIEFYGSVAPKDTVMDYGMVMYVTVDSLLRYGPVEDRGMEYMVGAYEATLDTMKYHFRVLPDYTYVMNEFVKGRDMMVSKTGRWQRTDSNTLLFEEKDRVFLYDNGAQYSSPLTQPGADSSRYKSMRFVYDQDSYTLVEKEAGELVFWKVYL